LLRLAAGLLRPSQGEIDRQVSIAFCPQRPIAVAGFVVREQVTYCAWLQRVAKSDVQPAVDLALERTGLVDLQHRKAASLSGGELARMSIASSLVGGQTLVLLDEPSAALDPVARRDIRGVLSGLAADGVTVISSSHSVDDVGPPYVDAIVMDRGRVVFQDSIDRFHVESHANDSVAKLAQALEKRS
jgi:ABC-2 type transport system ATP-binding protein